MSDVDLSVVDEHDVLGVEPVEGRCEVSMNVRTLVEVLPQLVEVVVQGGHRISLDVKHLLVRVRRRDVATASIE
jgi:hypothetical protein